MGTENIICDTDVLIDYLDDNHLRHQETNYIISNHIGFENILISAISKMELLKGARNKRELFTIDTRIKRFNILLINHQITDIAIDLIYRYNLSHNLALPDALIAATALYTQPPLFTYNSKDFKYIDQLRLFNKLSAK